MASVIVAGVGMTRFAKTDRTLRDLAAEAVEAALDEAGASARLSKLPSAVSSPGRR